MRKFRNLRENILPLILMAGCLFVSFTQLLAGNSKSDTNEVYIRSFHEYFYVKGISSQKRFKLTFDDVASAQPGMEFQPNIGNYLGFGIFVFDIGIDVLFRTTPSAGDQEKYGNSTGRDWQIHMYSRKIAIDLSYQRYEGFYVVNPIEFYPDWEDGDPHPRQDDMKARIINLGGAYIFKSERFSFPSIFNQTEAQLKSGGSWLISGQLNSSEISHTISIIPELDSNVSFGLSNLKSVKVSSVNVLPGYSHNFIIKGKMYLNLSLSLGLGYQIRSYTTEQSYQDNSINLANTWRIGAGYNGRRFFTGISAFTQTNNVSIQGLHISSSTGFVRFFLGYRFREWGIMRKSVFDLFDLISKKNKSK